MALSVLSRRGNTIWLLAFVVLTYLCVNELLDVSNYSCHPEYDPNKDTLPNSPKGAVPYEAEAVENEFQYQGVHFKSRDVKSLNEYPVLDTLDPSFIPSTVHYVWCGRRLFEFNHYLSVKSVIDFIKPDKIIFHVEHDPRMDPKKYNQWWNELRDTFPFLTIHHIESALDGACSPTDESKRLTYILERLANGGVYMSEFTILSKFPLEFKKKSLIWAYENNKGFILARQGYVQQGSVSSLLKGTHPDTIRFQCPNNVTFSRGNGQYYCVNTPYMFYPKKIWVLENAFGALCRKIFYGKEEILRPKPSYDELIPNIAHVMWIGGKKMDFLFYISILSLLYVVEVDAVYMHAPMPPGGKYWKMLEAHPKVKFIFKDVPETVYGMKVKQLSHVSDVWRVELMQKFGGIYVDMDAIFVNKIPYWLRGYDAVANFDWPRWDKPFPESINFGVSMAKRNSTFFRHFQETMRFYVESSYTFNGLRQPYKALERNPGAIFMYPHFQTICFFDKCHPTYSYDMHNENVTHLNYPFDWRKDTIAIHITYPTPKELWDEVYMLNIKTMYSDMARMVLEKAGQLRNGKLTWPQCHYWENC